MKKGSVLILGARSDMGIAIAHRFAQAGYAIQLAARNVSSLEADQSDIQLRHNVSVSLLEFDALDIQSHGELVSTLSELPVIAVCAVGYMGEQKNNEQDMQAASLVIRSNYEGPASILGTLANHFEQRGSGVLVGISSVAGERGRAANYVYGSAKAGFSAFLSGLRNRLALKGVHVVSVLPGFVYTKMTADLDLPAKLTAQPKEVADHIFTATQKQKNIIYVRPIWWIIMTIIKAIPEGVFKKKSI